MAEPFFGEIRMMGFNFAPYGWASCDGQLIPINQNTALYSLLGTNFGGDGRNTFGLPNFQGRAPIGVGAGPGLTPQVLAQASGSNAVALSLATLPPHTHGAMANKAVGTMTTASAGTSLPAAETSPNVQAYAQDTNALIAMAGNMVQPAGSGAPHENRQPYQVVEFCIALEGYYPQFD